MTTKAPRQRKKRAPARTHETTKHSPPQPDAVSVDFALTAPDRLDQQQILHLQRTIGNEAVRRMLHSRTPHQTYQPAGRPGVDGTAALDLAAPIAQSAVQSARMIQRAMAAATITGNAHLREGSDTPAFEDTINKKKYFKVNEKALVGHKLKPGMDIQVDQDLLGFTDEQKMGSGEWFSATADDYEGFIRADKVSSGGGGGGTPQTVTEGQKKLKGLQGRKGTGLTMESEFSTWEDPAHTKTVMGGVEGLLGQRGDSLELEKLKEFKDGRLTDRAQKPQEVEKEKAGLDTAGGSLTAVMGLMSFVKGLKDVITGTPTEKIAGAMMGVEGVAKLFAGVFKAVDSGTKAAGTGNRKEGDSLDIGAKITSGIADAASGLKSLVETGIKIFKQIRKAGKTNVASKVKGAMDIVKGLLETAASAVKSAKGFLDATGGAITPALMSSIPGLGIAISAATMGIKAFNFAKAWLQKGPIRKLERAFEQNESFKTFVGEKTKKGWFGKTQKLRELDKEGVKSRIKELKAKTPLTPEEEKELNSLKEWELTHEMKTINTKRQVRAGVQISNELLKIGGEIATLTGVGSTVGLALKATATVSEVGMSGFRRLKQFGRDKGWWGKGDKTSQAKHQKRIEHASLLFKMASELPHPPETKDEPLYSRVQFLFDATGVDMTLLQSYGAKNRHDKMFELVYKAMKERE